MKNAVLKCLTFMFCFCIAWFGGMYFAYLQLGGLDRLSLQFSEVNGYIKNNYLSKIDEKLAMDNALSAYIDSLNDKYARYYTAQEWEKFENENKGIVNGIGIKIEVNGSGNIVVTSVLPNSPAARAELEVDDVICKINNIEVVGRSIRDVANILQQENGDEFDIVFRRDEIIYNKTLTRENIELSSVEYCMDGYIGYIKIVSFNSSTVKQFEDALKDLQNSGAKALIFDLRNNPGGTLESVCKILNMLLPSGVIAKQVKSNGHESVLGMSDDNEINLPMATITNKNTASAAELFVCDLKDYNKSSQVGQTTYGKGVLQTTKRFSSGNAVKITTAYFNPAKSENFDKVGVKPDIEVLLDKNKEDLYIKGKLDLKDDDQYKAAVELLANYTLS